LNQQVRLPVDVKDSDCGVHHWSDRSVALIRPESRERIYWTNVSADTKVWIALTAIE
jgi:hypothetical protein